MKLQVVTLIFLLALSCFAQAVQVAFFIDDSNPNLSLEGEFSHVAISYQGKWLHSHPSRSNGRYVSYPGVHQVQNLSQIGLNYIVFENPELPDPSENYYNSVKEMHFNIFAKWNSKTETHCSKLAGKHLMQFMRLKPTKMKFKSSIWRHHPEAKKMRGELGMSPKEIFKAVSADPGFEFYYKSPFSAYKIKARKLKCRAFVL